MKKLRSGYTTGACAAAAAKAAALRLLTGKSLASVAIPLPGGKRVEFGLHVCREDNKRPGHSYASTIKDAGDDPDVTNGAEIGALACLFQIDDPDLGQRVLIEGGEGVGTVTKPGLAVTVGEAAINPVPRTMILAAVDEALDETSTSPTVGIRVTIIVPRGRELASKTLNERLGIIGGISILGTTGIVRPVSAEAWTATIATSMDVAEAAGLTEIVLSTGRTSEAALQQLRRFSPEAFVMMGDYLEFSLLEASHRHFTRLHLAGMWAKIVKAALRIPQTHVRFGPLEIEQTIDLIHDLTPGFPIDYLQGANTAREIYERLIANNHSDVVMQVLGAARDYHQRLSTKPVVVYLVSPTGKIEYQTKDG